MRFKATYVDGEHYYAVGIDEETGGGLIEIASIGVFGASLYFRLTDDEYRSFLHDQHALADLAEQLTYDKGVHFYADRLIHP